MAHGCTWCTRINIVYSDNNIHLSLMHTAALWLWLCCLQGCNRNDPDMYIIQPFLAIQPKRAWITWRWFLCDPAGWAVGSWNLDLVLMCLELSRFSAWGGTNNAWVAKKGTSIDALHIFRSIRVFFTLFPTARMLLEFTEFCAPSSGLSANRPSVATYASMG